MSISKKEFFKRQITLPEINLIGQEKLQNAKVLVVGCGGLGGSIAVHLAASGVGKLHLVDFDTINNNNLHRQVFFALEDIHKSKVETLSLFIQKRAPFTKVTYTNLPVTKKNVFHFISDADIVVDGTDSLPTKYLLNDACVLKNKTLIYGSLHKFDGYISCFNLLQKNGTYSTNLRDAFPVMAADIPNCEETGTLNTIVSLIATLQVNEILKLITETGKPLINQLLVYNSLQNSQLKIKLKKKITKEEIRQIFKTETYFDANCESKNPNWLISSEALKAELLLSQKHQKSIKIISLFPNKAIESPFLIHKNIPLSTFDIQKFCPKKNEKYVLVCIRGNSSYKLTKLLKKEYPTAQIYSLTGGITNY